MYVKRDLCVSFGHGAESVDLSLKQGLPCVRYVLVNFFPAPLFPLSIYCISTSTSPFNICSGVKAGIPFRISPLKCAHVTFIVEGTGETLQEEGGFCCRFLLLHNWSAVWMWRWSAVLWSSHGPLAISKNWLRLMTTFLWSSQQENCHSKPRVNNGVLTLSTWLLPWKSVFWGLSNVDITSFRPSTSETCQLPVDNHPIGSSSPILQRIASCLSSDCGHTLAWAIRWASWPSSGLQKHPYQ